MAAKANEDFLNFDTKLSADNPIDDYMKLLDEKMKAEVIVSNEVYRKCWEKIAAAARDTIWKMLFNEKAPPQKEQLQKASEFLKLHKEDACFYGAKEYNNWIVLLRDELLKREMFDFWKNEIVENELGPCWARDSDLFDDTEDPEPAKFYKYADCEAPWLKKKPQNAAQNTLDLMDVTEMLQEFPKKDKAFKKLSKETPLQDYKYNMEISDDDDHKDIFKMAADMVWDLLFGGPSLTDENSKKAAELLAEYKRDAAFYCPWDYNDWIPKVKDELLKRKYMDFWQNVIVKDELGLCWARDSDYFDDMEDPEPLEFYKIPAASV